MPNKPILFVFLAERAVPVELPRRVHSLPIWQIRPAYVVMFLLNLVLATSVVAPISVYLFTGPNYEKN